MILIDKMPENCLECMLKSYDENEYDYYCPFTNITCLSIGRQDNCPLKSADGLIEKFSMVKGCGDFIATQDVIDIIKEYCGMGEE